MYRVRVTKGETFPKFCTRSNEQRYMKRCRLNGEYILCGICLPSNS
jgi:hypothetical protein